MRELSLPEEGLDWFWGHVEASGLHDLIYIGYSTVTHAMVHALCERWHTETNNFHLPVGEIAITLDDVYNLLHHHIHGRMLDHEVVVDWARDYTNDQVVGHVRCCCFR